MRTEELLALGMFGQGSRLSDRVARLVTGRSYASARASEEAAAASGLLLLACGVALTLTPRIVALAQTRPQFEVVSVRPAGPDSRSESGRSRPKDGTSSQQRESGNFTYTGTVLIEYIEFAYGLKNYQWSPQPPRSLYESYDINAKAGRPVSDQEARLMFQSLLEERFKLKLHRETKEASVYALVVGKNGPKFEQAVDDRKAVGVRLEGQSLRWHNISMEYLADWIAPLPSMGRPVLDRTGLSGLYDLTLNFESPAAKGDDPVSIKTGLRDAVDASIFSALQDLGLKLEAAKAPMDFYTVEHVEAPDAN